ncbi:hypothetical protein [Roseibium aestuarii]|uniref:DUF732 domain-containing protein n=1 Tax=Roseibium aestuarii TaxID=2600299 RepID=A0ABW4JRJ6_9HYPH|nr:hypothetical protein [Roseibium aestuarii]
MADTPSGSSSVPLWPRLAAVAIALACLALMGWIGRDDVPFLKSLRAQVTGESPAPAATGNPELDACLAKRLGDVEQMKLDGVIAPAQEELFRSRAVSFCETQFPRDR